VKLYDFECPQCHYIFEELASEGEIIECPECMSHADKLVSFFPSAPYNAKMSELFMKFRKSYNKYKDASKEARPRM